MKKELVLPPAKQWSINRGEKEKSIFVASEPAAEFSLCVRVSFKEQTLSPFVYFDVPFQSKIMMSE